ncbi:MULTISPECIES: DUF6596 domain-containing protein [unclassified Rhodococcus (in: high G+C Gram-positive bacteria)]|uniref:RNA polymerase sigma factor n=1 Tax=unclassified Rhodococcus (in: high G+C Gram-positive bacteria) TaxID=192944 RepID=UPI0026933B4F|nr:DUF6596 domain-containing protein [Rhodococcus sp. 1163]
MDLKARNSAENSARGSYGRLLALLAAASRDIAGAEDALADAFERALTTWPRDGVPSNPDGWLLTVARNRQRDVWKSAPHRMNDPLTSAPETYDHLAELDPDAIEDKRLELMLVCAHPAISPAVHTPLMLDVVLGYTAKDIARAFALPSSTLAARLGRAKRRIREAGISFELPDRSILPERVDAVQAAVYGAFAIDWHTSGVEMRDGLASEALHLAETLCTLLPEDPEAHGLAALILLSTSRLPARRIDGVLVPIQAQDVQRWDEATIARGESHLRRAHAIGALGRFQLEATIQAVHCARRHTGSTDWATLRALHTTLDALAPTLGGSVALAAVTAETDGPESGLRMLDELDGTERFQPAWAVRAHLLERLGRVEESVVAYEKAISLSADVPTRRYLRGRADALLTR